MSHPLMKYARRAMAASTMKPGDKVSRAAFIYAEAHKAKNADQYAQCGTCMMFVPSRHQCMIHGPDVKITKGMTCTLYVEGDPADEKMAKSHPPMASVMPAESGLEDRQVRCENCNAYDAGAKRCKAYAMINEKLGGLMHMDPNVSPKGCCTANHPRMKE